MSNSKGGWTAMQTWWARLHEEGHDDFSSYEIPLGMAILASYALMGLLNRGVWVAGILFWAGVLVALWKGHSTELARVYALGRRRFRGTLSLRLTWVALLWGLVLAIGAVQLAHARALHTLAGWADGPLVLLLTLGLYYLGVGCKTNVGRRVYLGLILCAWAVLVVGVPLLRENLHWSTGLLAGGALIASGYVGEAMFKQRLRLIRGE